MNDEDDFDPAHPTDNEELVRAMMTNSRYGNLAQIFVIDAITRHSSVIANKSLEDLKAAFGAAPFISAEAWHGVATEIKSMLDAFYGRT